MGLLSSQVTELKAERTLLLDRLMTIGGIGPLTTGNVQQEVSEEEEETPELDEMQKLMNMRRRPSQLAAALTRKSRRDHARRFDPPSVARIPDLSKINAALDEAEALGKK